MRKLSEGEAWRQYQRLALQMQEQPALATDYTHCTAMARAWRVWFDLFTELDHAA